MYQGKIKVWVTYHFADDEFAETILEKVVNNQAEVWELLDKVYPENKWRGDDGEDFDEWSDLPEFLDDPYNGTFYQACAYVEGERYFLATCSPVND